MIESREIHSSEQQCIKYEVVVIAVQKKEECFLIQNLSSQRELQFHLHCHYHYHGRDRDRDRG